MFTPCIGAHRYYENPLVLLRPFYIEPVSCKTFEAIKTRSCVSVSPLGHSPRFTAAAGLLKIKKPQKAIGLSRALSLSRELRRTARQNLSHFISPFSGSVAAARTTPDLNYACSRDGTFATRCAPTQNPFFVPILAAAPPTRQGKHTHRRDGNFLERFFPCLLLVLITIPKWHYKKFTPLYVIRK